MCNFLIHPIKNVIIGASYGFDVKLVSSFMGRKAYGESIYVDALNISSVKGFRVK